MLNENGNLSNREIQETILPEKQKSIQPFPHLQRTERGRSEPHLRI